jgi:hypothetical protein
MPNRYLNLRLTDNTEETQSEHHNKIEQILKHTTLNTYTINLQQNDNNHTQRSKRHTNSKPVLSNIGHGATMVDTINLLC